MLINFSLGKYYGIDSVIELLIIVVSFIISIYSYKIYKFLGDKRHKYFSLAFLFIGISFIFKILSNLTIYNKIRIVSMNVVYTLITKPNYMDLINFSSFILFKVFHLLGFLILFLVMRKTHDKEKIFLFFYLALLAIILSIFYNPIFHITLVLIIIFLTINFYQNYLNIKSKNSFYVFLGFLVIFVSHMLFSLNEIHSLFYAVGELFLLIGFSILLINQMIITHKNKGIKNEIKKNKTRSNKRYVKDLK